jgi:hypothetical protein
MQSYKRSEDRDLPEKVTYELPFPERGRESNNNWFCAARYNINASPAWNQGPTTHHPSLVLPKTVKVSPRPVRHSPR